MPRKVLPAHTIPKQHTDTDQLKVRAHLSTLVELPLGTAQYHRAPLLRDSSVSIIEAPVGETKETETLGRTTAFGNPTTVSLRADSAIDDLQPLFGVTIAGTTNPHLIYI